MSRGGTSATPPRYLLKLAAFGLGLLCLAGVVGLQQEKLEELQQETDPQQSLQMEAAKASRLSLLKHFPAFGFDNLLADAVYLDFIQYFGDTQARKQSGYKLVPDYFDAVIERDPRFVQAYLYFSPASTIYAGQPGKTVALMNRGLKLLDPGTLPRDYFIWSYKATDELLFLEDFPAAEASYRQAAAWARLHSDAESQAVARRSLQTAEFLARNPDSRKLKAETWTSYLNKVSDQAARERVIREIEALGGKVIAQETPTGITYSVELPPTD